MKIEVVGEQYGKEIREWIPETENDLNQWRTLVSPQIVAMYFDIIDGDGRKERFSWSDVLLTPSTRRLELKWKDYSAMALGQTTTVPERSLVYDVQLLQEPTDPEDSFGRTPYQIVVRLTLAGTEEGDNSRYEVLEVNPAGTPTLIKPK